MGRGGSTGKGQGTPTAAGGGGVAKYDPEGERGARRAYLVVNDLVLENPVFFGQWSEAFHPGEEPASCTVLQNLPRSPAGARSGRSLATNLLADYAADQPQVLADLVMDADEKQFAVIYPKFKEQGEQGFSVLTGEIDKKLPFQMPTEDEER